MKAFKSIFLLFHHSGAGRVVGAELVSKRALKTYEVNFYLSAYR